MAHRLDWPKQRRPIVHYLDVEDARVDGWGSGGEP